MSTRRRPHGERSASRGAVGVAWRGRRRVARSASRGALQRLRAGRPPAELARLRGSFVAWLVDHGVPPGTDTDALWDDTVSVVQLAAERAGLTDLHHLDRRPGDRPRRRRGRRPRRGRCAARPDPAAGLPRRYRARTPRSMWDIPGLASLWEAASNADLLIVTPTEATPAPLARGWLSGDAEQTAQARRRLAAGYLVHVLTVPSPALLPHPLLALLPALAAAALGRPSPVARLLHPAGPAYRLRIELKGAQPPVWRDVLVDPNLTLDELARRHPGSEPFPVTTSAAC